MTFSKINHFLQFFLLKKTVYLTNFLPTLVIRKRRDLFFSNFQLTFFAFQKSHVRLHKKKMKKSLKLLSRKKNSKKSEMQKQIVYNFVWIFEFIKFFYGLPLKKSLEWCSLFIIINYYDDQKKITTTAPIVIT